MLLLYPELIFVTPATLESWAHRLPPAPAKMEAPCIGGIQGVGSQMIARAWVTCLHPSCQGGWEFGF